MISVRKPGTDEVIDRVFFTGDIEQGKQYWALARIFMQEGPEALSEFTHAPTDWNSDDLHNPFHRLAPKVQWPPEMDLESRTAPPPKETNDESRLASSLFIRYWPVRGLPDSYAELAIQERNE